MQYYDRVPKRVYFRAHSRVLAPYTSRAIGNYFQLAEAGSTTADRSFTAADRVHTHMTHGTR